MEFTPASPGSLLAFSAVLLAVIGAMLLAVHVTWRSIRITVAAGAGIGAWLGLLSAVVASGRLTSLPLNGLPFFFGSILLVVTTLALAPVGARMAAAIPVTALVGFQAFRLPLELVLHSWARQGVVPETMTWSGANWDIISGALALVCAPFAHRHPAVPRLFNIVGFALLLNVIGTAVKSSPLPFGWDVQPKLLLAYHLPYALIGPVCVGGALFGHLVLTRALWRRSSTLS